MRLALDGMPSGLSVRARCRVLAKRVVAHLVAESVGVDRLGLALAKALAVLQSDPAYRLATDPDADLLAEFERERLTRYQTRGCRQLDRDAWLAETNEIAGLLERRFAERFRRACK